MYQPYFHQACCERFRVEPRRGARVEDPPFRAMLAARSKLPIATLAIGVA